MKTLCIVAMLLTCSACGSESHVSKKICGKLPDTSSLSPLEKKVVEDAVQRNVKECGSDFASCVIALQKDQKFIVRIQTKIFDPSTGKCAAIIGGTRFEKYREDGSYESTLHSF